MFRLNKLMIYLQSIVWEMRGWKQYFTLVARLVDCSAGQTMHVRDFCGTAALVCARANADVCLIAIRSWLCVCAAWFLLIKEWMQPTACGDFVIVKEQNYSMHEQIAYSIHRRSQRIFIVNLILFFISRCSIFFFILFFDCPSFVGKELIILMTIT